MTGVRPAPTRGMRRGTNKAFKLRPRGRAFAVLLVGIWLGAIAGAQAAEEDTERRHGLPGPRPRLERCRARQSPDRQRDRSAPGHAALHPLVRAKSVREEGLAAPRPACRGRRVRGQQHRGRLRKLHLRMAGNPLEQSPERRAGLSARGARRSPLGPARGRAHAPGGGVQRRSGGHSRRDRSGAAQPERHDVRQRRFRDHEDAAVEAGAARAGGFWGCRER